MAVSKQIDWGDDSGDKISVEASEFSGNQVLRVTSPQNTRVYKRSIAIVVTSSSDPTKKATINLSQEAAPATLSLNVQSLVFSQRADSLEVQLTTNDNWQTSSNDEIPIPDEVTLKYNPWTDMVEMVDQPQQVYDAVEASDDYIMAMVRVGFSNTKCSRARQEIFNSTTNHPNSLEKGTVDHPDGFTKLLLDNLQNPQFHRIIPRGYMREPGQVPIHQGIDPDWEEHGSTQTYLYPDSALINKPGKVLGLRGCPLYFQAQIPFFAHLDRDKLFATNDMKAAEWATLENKLMPHTSTVKMIATNEVDPPMFAFGDMFPNSRYPASSGNGPIGYILYKKKGTSGYKVRGFDNISNFALARMWLSAQRGGPTPLVIDRTVIYMSAHFGDIG
jgi:hypothetical protein